MAQVADVRWGRKGTFSGLMATGWVVLLVYTVATIVQPQTQLVLAGDRYRVVIEVAGACALLFAALALSLPAERDVTPARDAFVAALIVLAFANIAFGVGPAVLDDRPEVDRGLALYPWAGARYVAGLLFIAAALERPRLGLRLTVGWALVVLCAVELGLILLGDRLPVLVVLTGIRRAPQVVAPLAHSLLQLVPGILFGVGSWLAARLYLATRTVMLKWLSLALSLQVAAQLHEMLYPALLGPVVTSADALRVTAFCLLLVGAVAQVSLLYRSRSRTVRAQQRDLHDQAEVVERLAAFAEKEELFRSIVAHELATPVATMRAYAELIAARAAQPGNDRVHEAVAAMTGEADRLLALVNRLDELREVGPGGVRCELRPVRIEPLLHESLHFVQVLDGTRTTEVRCPDVRVLADPVRLGQLLRSVLANAVKFSPRGSRIDLVGEVVGDALELRIRDRGPGIPPEEREFVLRRSARGSSGAGTHGSGLGLYLAQQIAEGHGTRLQLSEGPGGVGTEVVLRPRLAT